MDFSALNPEQKPAIHPVSFETRYQPDPEDKTGAKMIAYDWVTWVKKGSSNGATCGNRVSLLKKGSVEWPAIEPFYEAWKKNQDAPVDGTPLDAWPGLTPQQAKVFRDHNLRSVEDIAEAPDGVIAKIGIPGARNIQTRAKAFVEAAKGRSAVAEELARRDQDIAALKAQLADAMAAIKEMKDDDKPRRGRPPKDA